MSNSNQTDDERPDDLSDEIAKKYDKDHLLKMFSTRVRGAGRSESVDLGFWQKYSHMFPGVTPGDFKVITGEFANKFTRERNAKAVTVGNTGMILMGNSASMPRGSGEWNAILAHEIRHVHQNKSGPRGGLQAAGDGATGVSGNREAERDAGRIEEAVRAKESGSSVDDLKNKAEAKKKRKEIEEQIIERALDLYGEELRSARERNPSI